MDLNKISWRDISADWDCSPGSVLKGVVSVTAWNGNFDFHIYAIAVYREDDEEEETIRLHGQTCESCSALDDLINLANPDGPFERLRIEGWPHEYVVYMYPFVE